MYKIIFIDEQESEINDFQLFIYKHKKDKDITIIPLKPTNNLEEFLDLIFEQKADAIITDYRLNENTPINIPFNGVDLIKNILHKKENFPCFVLTSFDDDAVNECQDVNIIYVKNIIHQEELGVKITFLERVLKQIDKYKKELKNAEDEMNKLLEKTKKESLTAQEEERLIELDSFIEKAINKTSKLPENIKKRGHLNELYKLIDNTDKLLEELKKENK